MRRWLPAAMAALLSGMAHAGELVILPDAEGTTAVGTQPSQPLAFESAYTSLDLEACLILASDDFGTSWACPGYRGFPVWIAEGDLRFFVSFGFGAPDEPAAAQTLSSFNTLGETLEWRLSRASGSWRPIAAIVPYKIDATEDQPEGGDYLAVTQLVAGKTCQLAIVDVRTVPEAITVARQIADTRAGGDCPDEPEYLRSSGKDTKVE